MERNLYILVAYDGTRFHGWQRQGDLRTVQKSVEDSVRRVARHPLNLIGCSRTDAGVHALGHVSNFRTTRDLEVGKLRHAIGSRLPDDLSIVAIRDVHSAFHATRSAISKQYCYRVHNSERRPAGRLTHRYAYHVWQPLDVDRMQAAARYLVGTMDFRAMATRSADRPNTVRTVMRCDVERIGDEIRMTVEGTGFLFNQVRNMAGTLLRVGRGHWAPEYMAEILASEDRGNAGSTAPAKGLTLQWVRYPPRLLTPEPHYAGEADTAIDPCSDEIGD